MLNKCKIKRFFQFLFIFISIYSFSACESGGGDGDSGSSVTISSENQGAFLTRCGVIDDGNLTEEIRRAESVIVEVLGSDTVIITRTEGRETGNSQLVRLHGITSEGVSSYRILHGISVLKERLKDGAYFVSPGPQCSIVLDGGGLGITGQIFSLEGESMSELMLKEGSAVPFLDICGGDILSECYRTIELVDRPPSNIELDIQEVNIESSCGVVRNGAIENPIRNAELVKVTPISSSSVSISPLLGVLQGKEELIQLQGLSNEIISNSANRAGINYISRNASPEAYLVRSSFDCSIEVEGQGMTTFGQIYSKSGISINEELVKSGFARASLGSPCGSTLIETCYNELGANAPIIADLPPSAPSTPSGGSNEHGEDTGFPFQDGYFENLIRNFLWKPVSESNGRVVVLVNPLNIRIEVQGAVSETLVSVGESNGRGTTARGQRPGCAYGSNVRLRFFNSRNEQIPVASEDGLSVVVPDGCRRFEFRR